MTPPEMRKKVILLSRLGFCVENKITPPPPRIGRAEKQKRDSSGGRGGITANAQCSELGVKPQTRCLGNLFADFGRGHLRTRPYKNVKPRTPFR